SICGPTVTSGDGFPCYGEVSVTGSGAYCSPMLGGLAEAIEQLEVPADAEALKAVLGLRGRLEATIAVAVAEFDRAQGWDADAATSMLAWLRDQAGLSRRDAATLVSAGRRVTQLPVLQQAWREGTLSSGQVDAVLAAVGPKLVETFAKHE